MKRNPHVYRVTADADELHGWTAPELAAALMPLLNPIGVDAELNERQHGGGGLVTYADMHPVDFELLSVRVNKIVEDVIQAGPATAPNPNPKE